MNNKNFPLKNILVSRINWFGIKQKNPSAKIPNKLKGKNINEFLGNSSIVNNFFNGVYESKNNYRSTGILKSIHNGTEKNSIFKTNQLGFIYEMLRYSIEYKESNKTNIDSVTLFNTIKDNLDPILSFNSQQEKILIDYLNENIDNRINSVAFNLKKHVGKGTILNNVKYKGMVISNTDMIIDTGKIKSNKKVIRLVEFKSGTTINEKLIFQYFVQTIRYVLELYCQGYYVEKVYIHLVRSYIKERKNILTFKVNESFINSVLVSY